MLGLGWLTLRQVQEALRNGRLEEAERLLAQPAMQNHKRGPELLGQLAHALAERGEGRLQHDGAAAAWQDLLRAERADPSVPEVSRLRQALNRLGRAEPATVVTGPVPMAAPGSRTASSPRFLLWIDGIGGYLLCLGNQVTIGLASPEGNVDIPLFADVSRHHATLTRDPEGYLLEAVRAVTVNGNPVERTLLHSGDRVTLGKSCQLLFQVPVPISASARLDLVSGHRLRLTVDAVLLMAESLVLGQGPQAHVILPELSRPVVLFRHPEGLGIRSGDTLLIDGRPCQDHGVLQAGASVRGEDFSLALEPWA
jgi:hypothetical protein